MFANTSIAFTQQEEYDGILQDESATGRGAMVSFEASYLTFAEEFLNDAFDDLDDDSDDEDDTVASASADEPDRGYARIESRLVRKHVVSGALTCAPSSSTSAHKGPTYHFTSHDKNLGLYDFASQDASRLSAKNTTPTAPPTNHRRTNSCPTTDLSELIADIIATSPAAEMKKSAKDQAPAA